MSTVIPLPWTNPPISGNRTRGNPFARANEVKVALEAARYAVRSARPEPMMAANVTLHLRIKDRRRRDSDGMYPTYKVAQDALVLEGVLPDDSWAFVPRASCEIHPPTSEGPAMWVTLEEVA